MSPEQVKLLCDDAVRFVKESQRKHGNGRDHGDWLAAYLEKRAGEASRAPSPAPEPVDLCPCELEVTCGAGAFCPYDPNGGGSPG